MSGRGPATLAGVAADCWRRPGMLVRELAWRWLYALPALAVVALACEHIYRVTSGTLAAAGIGQISLYHPWQSAAVVAVVFKVLRPRVMDTLLWLLPLLGFGWAIAAGVGRNLVLRYYRPELPWRPAYLTAIQALRVLALAVVAVLWWGGVRWSAGFSTVAGIPNLPVYFGLVAGFTIGFLVLWSLFSWVFLVAPMFVLLEGRSLIASLGQSIRPRSARGQLLGVNVAVATVRFAAAVVFTVLSLLPLGFVSSGQSVPLYAWLIAVTVIYMAISGYFQVVRLAAFVAFWKPMGAQQNQMAQL